MAVVYYNLDANFETCTSIESKITKIDAIIDALLTTALTSVRHGDVIEYRIDTGQTVQQVQYSTVDAITKSIQAYENIRQFYVNRLLGSKWRNIGEDNLKRRW